MAAFMSQLRFDCNQCMTVQIGGLPRGCIAEYNDGGCTRSLGLNGSKTLKKDKRSRYPPAVAAAAAMAVVGRVAVVDASLVKRSGRPRGCDADWCNGVVVVAVTVRVLV